MISALVTGTLVGDPVERQTREGKPFVTASHQFLEEVSEAIGGGVLVLEV